MDIIPTCISPTCETFCFLPVNHVFLSDKSTVSQKPRLVWFGSNNMGRYMEMLRHMHFSRSSRIEHRM